MNKPIKTNMNLNNLEFHELANVFPLIDDEQTKELADDIKKTGRLIEPLALFEGKILDGRNRYNAAKLAGYTLGPDDVYEYEPDEDGDPLVFVYGKNILRRHLTVGQRGALAAELKERMTKGDGKAKDKTKKAAGIAGVAASSVEQAGFVKKHAPDTYEDLKSGKKTLHKAMTEAAKKAAAASLDKAWAKIQAVCGKSFVGALKEDQVAQLTTPKNIQAFAELPDEKMKAVVPVLKLGWKLNRAITFLDKEITPASTISQTIDLFTFKGSKRFEFEMDGVKFVLSKVAPKTNGEKDEKE